MKIRYLAALIILTTACTTDEDTDTDPGTECTAEQTSCHGACVDLNTSTSHCGAPDIQHGLSRS